MKKILLILIVITLSACQQKKIERLQFVQDSIRQIEIEKDSSIYGFVTTMNEIQQNLDSIRKIEEFVKLVTISGHELSKDARSNILDDIKLIHKLLRKNKKLVADLQKDLDESSNNITGLQRTIYFLNKQIAEKDANIEQLSNELEKLHLNVASLNTRIQAVEEDVEQKDQIITEKNQTIEQQILELNTAFYVYGTMKELVESGVVKKEGGVLGVGRSAKFREDFNQEAFTMVDVREFSEISLNSRKAEVITTHPAGTFQLVGENEVESLLINDAQKFWETSKYLVVVVN